MKYWDGKGRADVVCFRTIPLWVHFLDIPAHLRSEALMRQIVTSYFPGLLAIDPEGLDRSRWSRAVRAFTEVTAADPLQTYCELETNDGETHKISFKYERIQPLCLYCGRLGHLMEIFLSRREDMAKGLPGVPSGEFKPSLKVGVHSYLNSVEEEDISRSGGQPLIRGSDPLFRSGSSSRISPSVSESLLSPLAWGQSLERMTPPDGFSRTNSPELFSPTFQLLFPEDSHIEPPPSPLLPYNLFNGFQEEANQSFQFSPMSPGLGSIPPGFESRRGMIGVRLGFQEDPSEQQAPLLNISSGMQGNLIRTESNA
ncbi:hypothetical protein LINPERPRIM_LOCUS21315 [Linum perenne]